VIGEIEESYDAKEGDDLSKSRETIGTAKTAVGDYLGIDLNNQNIDVLSVTEFDKRFAGENESLHGGIAAIRLPDGSIFIKQGFEQDAIHELIHASGALENGVGTFLNEGITQQIAETISKRYGLSVRETYGKEVRFVKKYVHNSLPTNLSIQDFDKGYIRAENKGKYVVDKIWKAHSDKFSDVDEWGSKPYEKLRTNLPNTLGTDLHLSYLVDELGIRH